MKIFTCPTATGVRVVEKPSAQREILKFTQFARRLKKPTVYIAVLLSVRRLDSERIEKVNNCFLPPVCEKHFLRCTNV